MVKIPNCETSDKTVIIPPIPIEDTVFLKLDALPAVEEADRCHAYVLPDDTVWVLNSAGDGFIQLTGGSGGGSVVTFVDNGDGTGTLTINGVPNTVITEDNVGLEIGARNILRGTANPVLTTVASFGTWVKSAFQTVSPGGTVEVISVPDSPVPSVGKGVRMTRTTTGIVVLLQRDVYLQKGNHTASVWVNGTVGAVVEIVGVRPSGIGVPGQSFVLQQGWNRLEVTQNVLTTDLKDVFRFSLVSNVIGEEVTILAPQVERSNIASDWRPAPEDYVSIGGGITEAPIDNKMYVRKNGAWVEIVIPTPATLTVNSVEEPLENISVEDL